MALPSNHPSATHETAPVLAPPAGLRQSFHHACLRVYVCARVCVCVLSAPPNQGCVHVLRRASETRLAGFCQPLSVCLQLQIKCWPGASRAAHVSPLPH